MNIFGSNDGPTSVDILHTFATQLNKDDLFELHKRLTDHMKAETELYGPGISNNSFGGGVNQGNVGGGDGE